MVDKGLASKSYADAALDSININCADNETIHYLSKLAALKL